ncbi:GspH/FimT family pseudopilin [Pseudothauera hydrothermalis]|uniref:GspH/FimT family pseudopilin n=1 Tax=Pseudothauera hydrothermalis TaxID=2184083 RepID=UPI000E08F933|nr:GspH/FimT family pseudopilin [Pseudothauera hydrothermalis]
MSAQRVFSPLYGASSIRGFTLLELMVVLAIVALLIVSTPFAVAKAYETMQYRAAVRHVLTGLKLARLEAMRWGRDVAFQVELDKRLYGVEGKLTPYPEQIELRLLVAATEGGQSAGAIRFYPDGSSTGGQIDILRSAGGGVRIQVDWLLGRFVQRSLEQ